MSLSVLTIVRNRTAHLANLIEGVRRSALQPDEVIVVDMSDEPVEKRLDAPDVRFERLETDRLPLARARNLAAACASGDRLVFLDVDCIPMQACLARLSSALEERDGLVCAEVRYLGPGDCSSPWNESDLLSKGYRHPVRRFPEKGLEEIGNPGLFWSLAFAIRRTTFARIGGFDENFTGYGAEDTDFGHAAQAAGCPLYFLGGAIACHQHHETFDPPLQHLNDIVANAIRYRRKWGWWPMEGWLQAFEGMGLIDWGKDHLRILRQPMPEELDVCRSAWPPCRK